jgi:predicted ATP-dependent serine protease
LAFFHKPPNTEELLSEIRRSLGETVALSAFLAHDLYFEGNAMNVIVKNALHKTPTGIEGLDEITNGGLPMGRTTLVCGGAGSGKTVLALEFLVKGVLQ